MPHPPCSAVIDSNVLISAAIAIDAGRMSAARVLVEDVVIRRGLVEHFTSTPVWVGTLTSIPFTAENVANVSLIEAASTLVTRSECCHGMPGCR